MADNVTAWVYMLRCADNSYYVGKYQGGDLGWRVSEHNASHYPDAYTSTRRPVALVWAQWFSRYDDAVAFERRLKGWSRVKKEALIRNDEAALKEYSRRGFKPSTLHPEGPRSGVTKGEGAPRAAVLRDASLCDAPQHEEPLQLEAPQTGNPQHEASLHPEEPRSGVTKGPRIYERY